MRLEFELKRSRVERRFLLLGHLVALLALYLSAVPGWGKLLACVGLTFSWCLPRRRKVKKLVYDSSGFTLVGEKPLKAELLPSTWRSRFLSLLHFRLEDKSFLALPVWRDSLPEDDYRRLQVVLRWQIKF